MTDKAKKASWKLDNGLAKYTGVDGGVTDFIVDNDFTPEIEEMLLYYGLKQKLADSIAGIGKGATDSMKIAEMTETYDRLVAGQWNKASTERAKLITEAEFMEKAQEQGVPEEMAKTMWELARTAQK